MYKALLRQLPQVSCYNKVSKVSALEREVSLLDKRKGVPTCQRYCRCPSDVTAAPP